MVTRELIIRDFLTAITYLIIVILIVISFWSLSWRLTYEIEVAVIALIAYTLLLILPFSRFKIKSSKF